MNDQIPAVTDDDRRLARDWAEHIAFNVSGLANARMRAAARVVLDAIAGMHTEYRAEYQAAGGRWFPVPNCCSCGSGWGAKQRAERIAAAWKADGYAMRIVRRHVTEPEEA